MIEVTTLTGAAIQQALNDAEANRSGPVVLLPRTYVLDSPITLPRGVPLVGAYPGVYTNPTQGTILRASQNMSSMLTTGTTQAREGYEVTHLLLDGNAGNGVSVDVALQLYGRKIRVDSVDVANVSGTGIHFLPSSPTGGQCWVNWLTRCHVGGCGGYALLNECSDSWFENNYLSASQSSEERSGGNSWMGNHFDNVAQAGLRVVASGAEGSGSRFIGNYFDKNPVGLLCTGSVAWTWFAVVSDNFFRANVVDVEVVNAQGLHVTGSNHRFGGQSDFAMKFQGCTGGLIDGCKFDPRYTRFTGKDASVKVRNCLNGNTLFEEG